MLYIRTYSVSACTQNKTNYNHVYNLTCFISVTSHDKLLSNLNNKKHIYLTSVVTRDT